MPKKVDHQYVHHIATRCVRAMQRNTERTQLPVQGMMLSNSIAIPLTQRSHSLVSYAAAIGTGIAMGAMITEQNEAVGLAAMRSLLGSAILGIIGYIREYASQTTRVWEDYVYVAGLEEEYGMPPDPVEHSGTLDDVN